MIPVNRPLLNGNEKKYLNECIETGWISSGGPFVKRIEAGFSADGLYAWHRCLQWQRCDRFGARGVAHRSGR